MADITVQAIMPDRSVFVRLLRSRSRVIALMRAALVVVLFVAGLLTVLTSFATLLAPEARSDDRTLVSVYHLDRTAPNEVQVDFFRPDVYHKDFLAIYVLTRAIADGVDPFRPIPELTVQYVGVSSDLFPHPTPHPPTMGIIFLPLALLGYRAAALIWFLLDLVITLAAVQMISRIVGKPLRVKGMLLVAIILFAWAPFRDHLQWGNVMTLLLLLLLGARFAILAGRPFLGGALIGLSLLIKPVFWPTIIVFVWRRDWRGLAGAASSVLAGTMAAVWAIGLDQIFIYVTRTLPAVTAAYRSTSWNLSLWSLGYRLFDGTGPSTQPMHVVHMQFLAPPLFESPAIATLVSAVVPTLVLLLAVVAIGRQSSVDWALCVAICVSILISPVAWSHYYVALIYPVSYIFAWLSRRDFPLRETSIAVLITALLIVEATLWVSIAVSFASGLFSVEPGPELLFVTTIWTFVPSVLLLTLGWFIASLGARKDAVEQVALARQPTGTTRQMEAQV